jgi:hypothetical protein
VDVRWPDRQQDGGGYQTAGNALVTHLADGAARWWAELRDMF